MFKFPRAVWLLGWVSLATDAATEAIYPLLPFFLTRVLHAGAVSLGIVEGAAEAANSLLKIISGRIADRSRGKRWLVLLGYGVSSFVRPFIAIATTWISQKSQTIRERSKWETRKRETLYGDFITEASSLVADAFDHTLDNPETLVKLYGILGRIRLVSSEAVLVAAEEVSERIVKLYAEPNRKIDEFFTILHGGEVEALKRFSDACRVELRKYSVY